MASSVSGPRTSLLIIALVLTWTFSLGMPAAAQQSELQKARDLINSGEYEAGIKLLEGTIAGIKGRVDQKPYTAEAYYLLAKIYFSVGEEEKSDENLMLAFTAYPEFSIEEPNIAFRVRVERVQTRLAELRKEEKAAAAAERAKLVEEAKASAAGGKSQKLFHLKVIGALCTSDSAETQFEGLSVSSFFAFEPAGGLGFEFGRRLALDVEMILIPKIVQFQYDIPAAGETPSQRVTITIYRWEISLPILAKFYILPVESKLRPYVLGGIHIAKVTWAVIDLWRDDIFQSGHGLTKQMDYGFILGGGADIGLGKGFSLFIEGRVQLDLVKLDNGPSYYGPDAARTYLLGGFAGIKF